MKNPLAILKQAAAHAGLAEFKDWLRCRKTWELWVLLAVLAGIDIATAIVDFVPLIDDAATGVPAFFIALELKRRWKEAKTPKTEEVEDGEKATAETATG